MLHAFLALRLAAKADEGLALGAVLRAYAFTAHMTGEEDKPKGHNTLGFLSRVSPDGRYVVAMGMSGISLLELPDGRMGMTLDDLEAQGYAGIARDLPEGTDTSNLLMVEM